MRIGPRAAAWGPRIALVAILCLTQAVAPAVAIAATPRLANGWTETMNSTQTQLAAVEGEHWARRRL
eukprot:1988764-Pyramimonas_sp.AAC.1